MWFKNLLVYRLTEKCPEDTNEWQNLLSSEAFTPCKSHDIVKSGWTNPGPNNSDELTFSSNGFIMLCLKTQEKILPSSVINEQLLERLELLSEKESRKASKKEKLSMKEDIIHELLPRAFSRTKLLHAYIDVQQQWLIINSSSTTQAEAVINLIRKCLGSFPAIPLSTKNLPRALMTDWLKNNPPLPFKLGGECELTDNEEKSSKISCKGQNLHDEDIQSHLKIGVSVTQLSLHWDERVQCTLNDKLAIKKLKFSDLLLEKAESAEDRNEQFDIDFALMTLEVREFLCALTAAIE